MRTRAAWDEMVIESILRTGDDRAVLSHHPPDMASWPGAANGDNLINICKYHWDETGLPRFSSIMVNKRANGITKPFPNAFIGAGMVFGRAQWIVDCPFDHYLQYSAAKSCFSPSASSPRDGTCTIRTCCQCGTGTSETLRVAKIPLWALSETSERIASVAPLFFSHDTGLFFVSSICWGWWKPRRCRATFCARCSLI